ncbi:MAG TPA: hypothetical protein VIJ90_08605 [Gemmatimonadaceae bacterium]
MNELQRIELKTEDRVNNGAPGPDCHFPTYVSVMATPHSHDPVQDYTRRASSADVAAVRVEWRARRLSWSRLAGALVVVLSIVYANRGGSPGIAWITAAIGAGAFIVLVRLHRHAAARATRERETAAACRAGVARCLRDWPNVPPPRLATSPAGRGATARDLDIFGDVSLFHLLDVSAPALGGTRVVEWLLADPADVATIAERQRSVAELRSRPAFLLDAALIGRHGHYTLRSASGDALASFVSWCGHMSSPQTPWPSRGRLAGCCVGLIFALTVWHARFAVPLIALLVFVQLSLSVAARRHLTATLTGLGSLLPQLRGLDASMRLIIDEAEVPGLFGTVQQELRREGAADALGKLDAILTWNDVYLTPMAHWPLNALVALDVHLAAALERWRARYGSHIAEWVDRTSSAQALTALATLAYENPDWIMPLVSDEPSEPAFDAERAAHPLLAPAIAVRNPVRLAVSGSVLVLSGSNMSGKTTYLRAIGLNAMLAFAGGPVCASQMVIRRARVRTSVRIEDDLGAGVSLFLAEVSRLRDIVRDSEEAGAAPVLFLFDEILHGTNAADRRYASQVVLRRLLRGSSWGVLTTHDPDLVTDLFVDGPTAAHAPHIEQGHFQETVQRDGGSVRMSFDYLLRPGPTTSANARLILESMGLGERSS